MTCVHWSHWTHVPRVSEINRSQSFFYISCFSWCQPEGCPQGNWIFDDAWKSAGEWLEYCCSIPWSSSYALTGALIVWVPTSRVSNPAFWMISNVKLTVNRINPTMVQFLRRFVHTTLKYSEELLHATPTHSWRISWSSQDIKRRFMFEVWVPESFFASCPPGFSNLNSTSIGAVLLFASVHVHWPQLWSCDVRC